MLGPSPRKRHLQIPSTLLKKDNSRRPESLCCQKSRIRWPDEISSRLCRLGHTSACRRGGRVVPLIVDHGSLGRSRRGPIPWIYRWASGTVFLPCGLSGLHNCLGNMSVAEVADSTGLCSSDVGQPDLFCCRHGLRALSSEPISRGIMQPCGSLPRTRRLDS